jgi:hypothetical protein
MEHKVSGMTFTEEESSRLILLRSLEWEALPVFATRGIAPIALFWFPWWQVCLALVACSLLWCPVRTRFVSLRVSMFVSFLNSLYASLLMNAVVAVIFFSTGRVALGFVALLWHFISTLLAFAYPPTRVPTIQEKLWAQMPEGSQAGVSPN